MADLLDDHLGTVERDGPDGSRQPLGVPQGVGLWEVAGVGEGTEQATGAQDLAARLTPPLAVPETVVQEVLDEVEAPRSEAREQRGQRDLLMIGAMTAVVDDHIDQLHPRVVQEGQQLPGPTLVRHPGAHPVVVEVGSRIDVDTEDPRPIEVAVPHPHGGATTLIAALRDGRPPSAPGDPQADLQEGDRPVTRPLQVRLVDVGVVVTRPRVHGSDRPLVGPFLVGDRRERRPV